MGKGLVTLSFSSFLYETVGLSDRSCWPPLPGCGYASFPSKGNINNFCFGFLPLAGWASSRKPSYVLPVMVRGCSIFQFLHIWVFQWIRRICANCRLCFKYWVVFLSPSVDFSKWLWKRSISSSLLRLSHDLVLHVPIVERSILLFWSRWLLIFSLR